MEIFSYYEERGGVWRVWAVARSVVNYGVCFFADLRRRPPGAFLRWFLWEPERHCGFVRMEGGCSWKEWPF